MPKARGVRDRVSWICCLFSSVLVCLILLSLLVWTEKDLHFAGLCVFSKHIKGLRRRGALRWPSVLKAVVILDEDLLTTYPN